MIYNQLVSRSMMPPSLQQISLAPIRTNPGSSEIVERFRANTSWKISSSGNSGNPRQRMKQCAKLQLKKCSFVGHFSLEAGKP